jgi:trehalose 6-phosphate phosphatase
MEQGLVDRWEPFRARPSDAGIFTDYDGTLSSLVDDPAVAVPLPGTAELLADLANHYGCVGVLTGRPVAFLEDLLPRGLLLVGLYGLEVVDGGVRRDHPHGGAWREVIDDLAAIARDRGPAGMRVEAKGLSLTLHYREAPELAGAVREFAERQAERSGLRSRPAKMSFELHPPIECDKGTALRTHASGLSAVCFVGDDVADLAAFDALDDLAADGVHTVRVAVEGVETPPELCGRADVRVKGPEHAQALLASLVMPDLSRAG